jgi:DNA-binding NarL/FixJ family response regulator
VEAGRVRLPRLDGQVRERAVQPPVRVAEHEREIVALVASGMSNAENAGHPTLSPLTVKTRANHAMTRLGARDRAQLAVLARQAGLPGTRLPAR